MRAAIPGKGWVAMTGRRRRIVAAAAAFLVLAFVTGCSAPVAERAVPGAKPPVAAATPEEAVRQFYDSGTKHGMATFHSGDQPDDTVEFWFAEDGRYRLTWYYPESEADKIAEDGPIRLNMISPDGKAVYYDRPGERTVELAPVLAEKQQWTFNGPPGWEPDAGTEEGGYVVFTYAPKRLWDIEGADQKFYLHDMRVLTRDGRVEAVEMRTNSDVVPEDELVGSRFTFVEFELDAEMPEGVFDLPAY